MGLLLVDLCIVLKNLTEHVYSIVSLKNSQSPRVWNLHELSGHFQNCIYPREVNNLCSITVTYRSPETCRLSDISLREKPFQNNCQPSSYLSVITKMKEERGADAAVRLNKSNCIALKNCSLQRKPAQILSEEMDEMRSIKLKRKFMSVIPQTPERENDSTPALIKGLLARFCAKTER